MSVPFKVVPDTERTLPRAGSPAYDAIAEELRAGKTLEVGVKTPSGIITAMKSRGIRVRTKKKAAELYIVWAEEKA